MAFATSDPARFRPYDEPFRVTVLRTGLIALMVGTIGSIMQRGRVPASVAGAHVWIALVLATLWISFGGHWVEWAYLNVLRPRIAKMPDWALLFVRIGVWVAGGTLLFLGAAATIGIMNATQRPSEAMVRGALRYGGLFFAAIELVVHTIMALLGRPSFWNLRG